MGVAIVRGVVVVVSLGVSAEWTVLGGGGSGAMEAGEVAVGRGVRRELAED